MAFSRPTTTHMGISDARAKLTSVVHDVFAGHTRIVVEKSGIPVAAFVSPADLAKLEELDRDRTRFFELMDQMQAAFSDVSEEELIEQAALSVADVREEIRAEAKARAEVQASRSARRAGQLVGVST